MWIGLRTESKLEEYMMVYIFLWNEFWFGKMSLDIFCLRILYQLSTSCCRDFAFFLFKTGIFCSFYPNFVSLDSKQFCDSVSRLVSDNSGALAEKMIDSRRGYNDSRGEGTMKVQCAWRGCTGGTIQLKTYSVSTILVCQRSTINRSHIVNSQEIGGQIFRISSNSLKIKLLQKRCFIYWCSMLSVLEYQLVMVRLTIYQRPCTDLS